MVVVCEVVVGELPFAAPGTIVGAAAMAHADNAVDILHKMLTLIDVQGNSPARQGRLLLVVLVAAKWQSLLDLSPCLAALLETVSLLARRTEIAARLLLRMADFVVANVEEAAAVTLAIVVIVLDDVAGQYLVVDRLRDHPY